MSDGAIRRLRLGSGLVLFAYILSHLINHSLGIISLDHAEAGLRLAMKVWHSLPGTVVLYGAAAVHFLLALRTPALRRHWRLPLIEVVRLASGLTLPLLLIGHVMATRMTQVLFDIPQSYGRTVANLAVSGAEGWQLALLAPGWLHGCLGLWITLRRQDWARRARHALAAVVAALPALAGYGFHRMVAEATALMPAGLPPAADQRVLLAAWHSNLVRGYIALILVAIIGGQIYQRLVARTAATE